MSPKKPRKGSVTAPTHTVKVRQAKTAAKTAFTAEQPKYNYVIKLTTPRKTTSKKGGPKSLASRITKAPVKKTPAKKAASKKDALQKSTTKCVIKKVDAPAKNAAHPRKLVAKKPPTPKKAAAKKVVKPKHLPLVNLSSPRKSPIKKATVTTPAVKPLTKTSPVKITHEENAGKSQQRVPVEIRD